MEEKTQNEKLEKPKKSNHGGRRPGSGRKPLLNKEELLRVKELIGQHGSEFDPLKKKERCLALLDVLYKEGVEKRNIAAIKEYFDRQLGKAMQGVDITSKGEKIDTVAGFNFVKTDGEDNPDNTAVDQAEPSVAEIA